MFFCIAEYTEASVHILALDGERLHQSISRLPAKKRTPPISLFIAAHNILAGVIGLGLQELWRRSKSF